MTWIFRKACASLQHVCRGMVLHMKNEAIWTISPLLRGLLHMDDYLKLQNTIIKKTLWLALGGTLICTALDYTPEAKGIALGALFGVLDFKIMALQMRHRLMGLRRTRDYLCTLGRFALLAVPLVVAIKLPYLSFAATVVGLLSLKGVIFFTFTRGASSG